MVDQADHFMLSNRRKKKERCNDPTGYVHPSEDRVVVADLCDPLSGTGELYRSLQINLFAYGQTQKHCIYYIQKAIIIIIIIMRSQPNTVIDLIGQARRRRRSQQLPHHTYILRKEARRKKRIIGERSDMNMCYF